MCELNSHPIDLVPSHPINHAPLKAHPIDITERPRLNVCARDDDGYACPLCGHSDRDYYYIKSHIEQDHGIDDEPVSIRFVLARENSVAEDV